MMGLETVLILVVSVVIGFTLGVFSGLIPGLHTNNFAIMLLALAVPLSDIGFPPFAIVVVILSNAITHTFFYVL